LLGILAFVRLAPAQPWGVLVRTRDGLIIESRSCLSETDLLVDMGLH